MELDVLAESTLAEVCSLVTDGTHDTPKRVASGYPLIKAKEIVGGRIDFETCDQISEEEHRKVVARSKPEFGDTLFAHIGASLGEAAFVNTTREFSIKNVALFKPKPTVIDARYLYYLVISPAFQSLAKGTKTGSAQPFLGLSQLRGHRIRYHRSLDTQRRIADILSTYDDLIENNLRRMRTLEELARALYREWFVDFRFPGRAALPLRKSGDAGGIPRGWRMTKVSALLARCPVSRIYKEGDLNQRGAVPVFDQSSKEIAGFHDHGADYLASTVDPVAIFGDHTCKMRLLIEPFSIGPNVVPFRSAGWPLWYVFFLLNGLVRTQEYKRHWSALTAKEVLVADQHLAQLFSSHVRPFVEMAEILQRSVRTLHRTRDLLLPRLLTGQLNWGDLKDEVQLANRGESAHDYSPDAAN